MNVKEDGIEYTVVLCLMHVNLELGLKISKKKHCIVTIET